MDLQETERKGVDLIHLAQHRDNWQAACYNDDEVSGSRKWGEFLD